MTEDYGIHWFRRDLRVAGNTALMQNQKKHQGRVVGVFFFDSVFLSRGDFSHDRFAFFLATLKSLREELITIGSDLLVLNSLPQAGFASLFENLLGAGAAVPRTVSFNRDYEPFARKRDASVETYLEHERGVEVLTESDHLLIEPRELTKDGSPQSYYQIYTPYARKWFERLKDDAIRSRVENQKQGLEYLDKFSRGEIDRALFQLTWKKLFAKRPVPDDFLEIYIEKNSSHISVPIPEAGSLAGLKVLREFKAQMTNYPHDRDYPAQHGTSRLSYFYKNGSVIPAQAIAELNLQDLDFKVEEPRVRYLKQLVWREFYYHILFHCPRIENEAFLTQYNSITWENNAAFFEAWKQGRTGFPIVDAGMRELNTTGWMHNRVRMIVGSFMVKDLLIDWRLGEKYFMEKLLDGDQAPNNGGWQWAASTGCDPQPYFRIFNPELQSKKFDVNAEYIKKYIPELRDVGAKSIHPIGLAHEKAPRYPAPIVNHAVQKIKALTLYQKARKPVIQ
jgi:deoxyribodipyrimidine photo-lyase